MLTQRTLFTSATPEWYTPPDLYAEIERFLGGMDLDPCPVPPTDGPDTWPDGLAIPWTGRVFCNPPYRRPIGRWITKAVTEAGISECVLLVPARTDTG